MNLSDLLTVGKAGFGAYNAYQKSQLAEQILEQQDPMAKFRAKYMGQLNNLMANPDSVTKLPGYEAGMQAIERGMARQGYTGSGNMMHAMSMYGQNAYQNQLNTLMQLIKGTGVPATQLSMMGKSDATSGYLSALSSLAGLGMKNNNPNASGLWNMPLEELFA